MTGKKSLDFSCLSLTDAVQLINSTPHGEVVSYRQIRYLKEEAGFRVAASIDVARLDLPKLAWYLFTDREKTKPKVNPKENKLVYDRNYRRDKTEDKQEIGHPPGRSNPKDWERACSDFRFFCETYKAAVFDIPWADDHLKVFELCQEAIDDALMYALAMPRGSGKTRIFQALVEWVILTGKKEFAVLVAATGKRADELMVDMKKTFSFNEKLQADFAPELHGIVALKGESRACE